MRHVMMIDVEGSLKDYGAHQAGYVWNDIVAKPRGDIINVTVNKY